MKHWFVFHAKHFDTVAINSSFIVYRRRRSSTRGVTRPQRVPLRGKGESLHYPNQEAEGLRGTTQTYDGTVPTSPARAGPGLLRTPATVSREPRPLERFLEPFPKDVTNVFEFRDPSWYSDTVCALLDQHGAGLCAHDMPGLESPLLAITRTAWFACRAAKGNTGGVTQTRSCSIGRTGRLTRVIRARGPDVF